MQHVEGKNWSSCRRRDDASSTCPRRADSQKKTKRVIHRSRADVIEVKRTFSAEVLNTPPEKLVFVDEMGVHLAMTPSRARSARGTRAIGIVPSVRASNISVVAATRNDEVLSWYPHDGAVDGSRFEAFLEKCVAPKLKIGDVVVLDNVSFHKSAGVKRIIESSGAKLLFTPAYHPEFNAIEEAFSVVKQAIRRLEPRNIVALVSALRVAFSLLTPKKLTAFTLHMLAFAIQPT